MGLFKKVKRDSQKLESLIKDLWDSDSSVQLAAEEALAAIGEPAVIPLIKALKEGNIFVQQSAWEILGEIGEPALKHLIQVLKDKNESTRWIAAQALGYIGDPKAVEPLIQVLNDESISVRKEAAQALGYIEDSKAVEPLIQALENVDMLVRQAAVEALGDIGAPSAVEPLIQILNDEGIYVRQAAVEALGKIGDSRALDPLTKVLKDEVKSVRQAAVKALEKIGKATGEPVSQDKKNGISTESLQLQRQLRDGTESERIGAAESLLALGTRGVPVLVDAMDERYDDVTWVIMSRLMNMEGDEADELRRALSPVVQYLIKIIDGTEIKYKGAESYGEHMARAINTLRAIGDAAAIPALLNLLEKIEPKIKTEGNVQEYVDAGNIRGYISSSDGVFHIRSVVDDLRKRQMKNK